MTSAVHTMYVATCQMSLNPIMIGLTDMRSITAIPVDWSRLGSPLLGDVRADCLEGSDRRLSTSCCANLSCQ